jgi:hypothetical protein
MRESAVSRAGDTGSPQQRATRLVTDLKGELLRNEDAETAVEVYKTANWVISRMEEVKQAALDLARDDMEQRDIEKLDTPIGSAGWTEPKAPQLDETAWARAMAQNRRLREIQRAFEEAEDELERAQEPYKDLPESRFYIR